MTKKVQAYVKLQVTAGMANPSPSADPALSQQGASIMEPCKAFNAKIESMEKSLLIPVVIIVYIDRSFTFVTKTPPAAVLLKKAAGIKSNPGKSDEDKMGETSRAQLQEIAQTRVVGMTGASIEVMTRSIESTACFIGLVVEDQEMAKLTERMSAIRDKVDATKQHNINEAIPLLEELATAEFVESIDVIINLGIDARKSDQNARGATALPHGTGRFVRVAVFVQGINAEAVKTAGAESVGMEDLTGWIKEGKMNSDVVIASPGAMRVAGQLSQALGPRGLVPNPKVGTVTPNVIGAVKNTKAGQVRYRSDKNGIIHTIIGKVDFDIGKLKENLETLLITLKEVEPTQAKGVYIKKVNTPTTMDAGVAVDQAGLSASAN